MPSLCNSHSVMLSSAPGNARRYSVNCLLLFNHHNGVWGGHAQVSMIALSSMSHSRCARTGVHALLQPYPSGCPISTMSKTLKGPSNTACGQTLQSVPSRKPQHLNSGCSSMTRSATCQRSTAGCMSSISSRPCNLAHKHACGGVMVHEIYTLQPYNPPA